MNEQFDGQDALAAVAQARNAAADRLVTPWWYHPILGVLLAGFAVAYGLGNNLVRLIGALGFFVGVSLLMKAYQRVTGLWIWGYQSGPATKWAYLMGIVGGLGMGSALVLAHTDAHTGWVWAVAGVMAVLIVVVGHVYDRALRAYLRGQP